MSDLIHELRKLGLSSPDSEQFRVCNEAAKRIEELEALVARLEDDLSRAVLRQEDES